MSIEQYLQNSLSKTRMGFNILCIVLSASLVDTLSAQKLSENKKKDTTEALAPLSVMDTLNVPELLGNGTIEGKEKEEKKEKVEIENIRLWLYNNDNYIRPYIGDSEDGAHYNRKWNRLGVEVWWLDAGRSYGFDAEVDIKKWNHQYKATWEITWYTMYGKEKDPRELWSYLDYLWGLWENEIAAYTQDERDALQLDKTTKYNYWPDIWDAQRVDQYDVSLQKLIWSINQQTSALKVYLWWGITGYGNMWMEKVQKRWHNLNQYPHAEVPYEQNWWRSPYIIWSINYKQYIVWKKEKWISFIWSLSSKIPISSDDWITDTMIGLWILIEKNKRKAEGWYILWNRVWPKNSIVINESIINGATSSYYCNIEIPLPLTKNTASVFYSLEKYTTWWESNSTNRKWWNSVRASAGPEFNNPYRMKIWVNIALDRKEREKSYK